MTSMAPDWTPATLKVRVSFSPNAHQRRGRPGRYPDTSGWLVVAFLVQKCPWIVAETPIRPFSTQLLVWCLTMLTTGSMAYRLLG
jgi:hypothetical protein